MAISFIRIRFLKLFEDFTWENVDSSCWSIAELTSALTCACLPTLRPLLSQIFPSLGTQLTRSRSGYRRYGSSSFGCHKTDIEVGFFSNERQIAPGTSPESQIGLCNGSTSSGGTYELQVQDSDSQSEGVVGLKNTRDEIAAEQAVHFDNKPFGITATVRTEILPTRPRPVMADRLEYLESRRTIRVQREVLQTKSNR